MIRFSKQGITFDYNNDELTWYWWWMRKSIGHFVFYSLIYDRKFESLRNYWMHVGSAVDKPISKVKVKGYHFERLFHEWVKTNLRFGYFVVLYDINLDARPASFWRSVPDRDKMSFRSDFVVLTCKDVDETCNLVQTIDTSFAYAYAVSYGRIFSSNIP